MDAPALTLQPRPQRPLIVEYPNGTRAQSVGTATLTAHGITVPAAIMREAEFKSSLYGHHPFTTQGCTVDYTDNDAIIRRPDGAPCIVATKGPTEQSWFIDPYDINPNGIPYSLQHASADAHANLVHRFEGVEARVKYAQALLLNSPKVTIENALRKGWLDGWLPVTATQFHQYAVDTPATHKGHMREKRSNVDSTRHPDAPQPPPAQSTDPDPTTPPVWWTPTDPLVHDDDAAKSLPNSYIVVRPRKVNEVLFADGKDWKGPRSRLGYTHEMVFVHNNYKHIELCKGADGATVADAYRDGMVWFASKRMSNIKFFRIDNVSTPQLRQLIQRRNVDGFPLTLEFCAVGIHRANRAEKAIQDVECAELSAMVTVDPAFPMAYWKECLPQLEIILNHLTPWGLDPSISAYHGLHGDRYDFSHNPMTILGVAISKQVDRNMRTEDDPYKAKDGFYVGPALEHHRCANVLVKDRGGRWDVQIEQQFAIHPLPTLRVPRLTILDELSAGVRDLATVLKKAVKCGPDVHSRLSALKPTLLEIVQRLDNLPGNHDPAADMEDIAPAPAAAQRVSTPPSDGRRASTPFASDPATVQRVPTPLDAATVADQRVSTLTVDPLQPFAASTPPTVAVHRVLSPSSPPPTPPSPARERRRQHRLRQRRRRRLTRALDDDTDRVLAACTASLGILSPAHPDPVAVTCNAASSLTPPTHPLVQLQQLHHDAQANRVPSTAHSLPLKSAYLDSAAPTFPSIDVPSDADSLIQSANAAIDLSIDAARTGTWSACFRDDVHGSARAALNLHADGSKLTYRKAMQGAHAPIWQQANDTEFYKLIRDTKTMHAIPRAAIPSDRRGDISYYSPQVKEKIKDGVHQHRVRGTYGGNLSSYPGRKSAKTAELEVVKSLLNAAVSEGANLTSIDIKDFYLSEAMERPEYLRIPVRLFSPTVLDSLNLRDFIDDGNIFFEVVRTMYGLPQSGYLAQQGLVKRLRAAGYHEDPVVPMLFTHDSNGVRFCLVVDDFLVKWKTDASLAHLITALRGKYEITIDASAAKYLGLTIDYDKAQRVIRLSMPGYVRKMLHQFQHRNIKPQSSPSVYTPPVYGAKAQQVPVDTSPPLSASDITTLQSIIGSALYYGRAVDSLVLTEVQALSSEQSLHRTSTLERADRLLGYMMANPDNSVEFRASDMALWIYSDASYLSRTKARSVAGGFHYASDATGAFNGAISTVSTIIDVVVSSAYEAEVAACYINAQRGEWIRTIFAALGYPQQATPLLTDNNVAVGFANDTIQHAKTKAIDMRFHWIRDRVRQQHFVIGWVPGDSNIADYFTKALPVHEHQRWAPVIVKQPGQRARTLPRPKRLPTPRQPRARQ